MLLVLLYTIIKGVREICKKKALEKNTVIEVLLVYTFFSLVMVAPQAPAAMGLTPAQYFRVAVKAFVIFVAWIASFKAIRRLPLSIYGILDLSRVIFTTLLGIFVLGEKMTAGKTVGLVLVSTGLLFLKFNPAGNKDMAGTKNQGGGRIFIFLAFLSCVLNAVSGLMDKILMQEMTSTQLQFWYILFMFVYYGIYALATKTRIDWRIIRNVWVWLLAVLLVVMDKALFIANGMEGSQITVMTLIKQAGVIVAIVAGKLVFKEKNILHKLVCAAIIMAGIIAGIC